MNKLPPPMLICAADIMRITGRSRRTAWRMMAAIRDHYNKLKYAPLTLDEFCRYTGFREEDVRGYLG